MVVTEIHQGESMRGIWLILFAVLLIAWIGGFTVFHVAGGLIHLLLVFAIISLILHFVMGARPALLPMLDFCLFQEFPRSLCLVTSGLSTLVGADLSRGSGYRIVSREFLTRTR